MALARSRKVRGAETQRIGARYWQLGGFPHSEPIGAGAPGCDLTGTPGVGVEFKARADLDLTGWLRQTIRNAGLLVPVLVVRPNGYGPEQVGSWPFVTTHAWGLRLLREAGYGDPMPGEVP